MVRVKEGPFADFNGNVEEVNYEKSKVRVSVTILVAPRPSNSISARSKDLTSTPGSLGPSGRGDITHKEHKHGEEDRRLYQAASAGW